jgi:CMP-N-acetylneuraminic acid synthetase
MRTLNRLAVIPARGGSKRVPRKNIVDFDGRPMIAWTIEAAQQSGAFDRIVVSTDDEEIAAVARLWGVDVPFLRETHADDQSPVSEAVLAAVAQAQVHFEEVYSTTAMLMPNCPLRGSADISAALSAFDAAGGGFQISCFRSGWMNPWWAHRRDHAGRAEALFPRALKSRSQDLPELYLPTGAIWVAETARLVGARTFYGPDHRFEPMPWTSAVDIDDFDDLAFARAVRLMMSGIGSR